MDLEIEVTRLSELAAVLKSCVSDQERIALLSQQPQVQIALDNSLFLQQLCSQLSTDYLLVLKSLITIGQWEHICQEYTSIDEWLDSYRRMFDELVNVNRFYAVLGGLVGYHNMLLSLLKQKNQPQQCSNDRYHPPVEIDISTDNPALRQYLFEGIAALPFLAEIYPVGGAADRLRLLDPLGSDSLPAALLPFCGFTLIEGLIRDLQAREYLYFKLFGKQVVTPVAMMTSAEKNNHEHIVRLCREKLWFGRGEESFRLFCQPPVPVMDPEGRWCCIDEGKLLMKPGGHGVLWKVAHEEGIFAWMQTLNRQKMLVRQINNPIAGVDYGLLAFCGVGFSQNKQFGFASCARQVSSAEGVNVLIEKREGLDTFYCLTNIEYCDFAKFSIEDTPAQPGGNYSLFPSNTNILFVDIEAAEQGIVSHPIPGMLVNVKHITYVDRAGSIQEKQVVRLESTMQNLADFFQHKVSDASLSLKALSLPTFLTNHKRSKTISAIKKMYQKEGSLLETPEGCFYDYLLNAHELLTQHCFLRVPSIPSPESYLLSGPSFLFFYHPALGPIFSIIGQKIKGGSLAYGSELTLEIADVSINNLTVSGVLQVIAEQVMGEVDSVGILQYSDAVGKCVLQDVKIENAGIDFSDPSTVFWKKQIAYKECCQILIQGNGEFYAQGITLKGSMCIEVKSGTRKIAIEKNGVVTFEEEPLFPSKRPSYFFADNGDIQIRPLNKK